jgi:hypothetical protein
MTDAVSCSYVMKIWLTIPITEFLDFAQHPVFQPIQHFGNWIFFSPRVKGKAAPILLGPLEKVNLDHWTSYWGELFLMNTTEQVPPTLSPKDGSSSSFWNAVFFRIADNEESKHSATSSTEHFRIYMTSEVLTAVTTKIAAFLESAAM